MKYVLKIDEEFKLLIPPLSSNERRQLEENIAQDGCREPLCVWNNFILDGHNRYEICTRLGIPFSVAHIFLKSRDDAVAWICANQLGRRNISEESRRYLIGKRYEAEKKTGACNPSGINQHGNKELRLKNVTRPPFVEPIGRTRKRLANEYNVSDITVARYAHYTKAIDALSKIEPELTPKILSGKIKMTHDDIVALSHLPPPVIQSIAVNLSGDTVEAIRYIKSRQVMKAKHHASKAEPPARPVVAIKDTPIHDPSALAESLIFTIPSWIRTIERIAMETDYTAITPVTYINLRGVLRKLEETAQTMLDTMEDASHG